MAGSQEDIVTDLLKDSIRDKADLRHAVGRVLSSGMDVAAMLALSEGYLERFAQDLFPAESSLRAKWGFLSAISRRKEVKHEGVPLAKRARKETGRSAKQMYYDKLLEPPADLPSTVKEIEEFLGQRPVKLPMLDAWMHAHVNEDELLTREVPEEALTLAMQVGSCFESMMLAQTPNEVTDSAYLFQLTGQLLTFLNAAAPLSRQLDTFSYALDAHNSHSTMTASQPLLGLLRPDFQLFVKGCLMLRWENKHDYDQLLAARKENVSKLKAWSPLFYGELPYVIGGCCAGKQFRWLRLVPKGETIDAEYISPNFDLRSSKGVAAFLHSNIRMHALLQKLQEKLTDTIKILLYSPMLRGDDVIVTIYPHVVQKMIPNDDEASFAMREALYTSIAGSKFLIQGKVRRVKTKSILLLEPLGNPDSRPVTLKELDHAIHDILCGLKDLHDAGYTHKDIRWDNCVKVNVMATRKWILIDLEAAGVDGAEWTKPKLNAWDEMTLETKGGKSKFTKASDIYLLGKLICNWLDEDSGRGNKRYEVMKIRGESMMQRRLPVAKVKQLFCKRYCERCLLFGF